MAAYVIALLDKPRRLSFRKYPFVVQDAVGGLHIHGLRNYPRPTLTIDELDQLVASQSVLRLPDPITIEDPKGKMAGWLGRDFQEQLRRLNAPPVPALPMHLNKTPDGDVWFESPERIYDRMEAWMNAAARDVFTDKPNARELSELMLGVLPGRNETRAAVWYTRPNDAEKTRHLRWYARLERGAGRPIEPVALETRFGELRDSFQRISSTHRQRLAGRAHHHSTRSSPFLLNVVHNGTRRAA